MFLYNYFKNSFKLTKIFEMRKENLFKVIIFFLLLNIIIAFPLNYYLIKNKGIGIEKIGLNLNNNIPDWFPSELPVYCNINSTEGVFTCDLPDATNQGETTGDTTTTTATDTTPAPTVLFEKEYNGMKFILDPNDVYLEKNEPNALIFHKNFIEFSYNGRVTSFSYLNFRTMSFSQLSTMTQGEAKDFFVNGMQNDFSVPSIIQGVIWNTLMYSVMNAIYVTIVALMGLLFKFGHKTFITYKELFVINVFSTTIPTFIIFFLGILELFAFTTIIYQFGSPLIFLLVYYRVIKHYV